MKLNYAKSKNKASTEALILCYSIAQVVALCLFGSGNETFAKLVLIGFIPLIFKPECLIGPLFFADTFSNYVLVGEAQSLSRYLILFFIAGVVMKMMFTSKRIKVDFWLIAIILMALLGLLFSCFGLFGYTSLPFTYLYNLLYFFCLLQCAVKATTNIIGQMWSFTVLSVLYSVWFVLKNGLDVFIDGRVGVFEEGVNANTIAKGLCILAIIVLAHFMVNNFKHKIFHVGLLMLSVFVLFLTGSRTGFIAFFIGAAFAFLYWLKMSKKKIGTAVAVTLIFFVGIYYLYGYMMEEFPTLMERFTVEDVVASGGTGRVDVWSAYMTHYFPDYWLFGIGFDPLNMFHAAEAVNGIGHGAHNILIDILSASGLVGLTLFTTVYVRGFLDMKNGIKANRNIFIPLAMMIGILATGIGENVFRGRALWFAISLGALLLKERNAQIELENEQCIQG